MTELGSQAQVVASAKVAPKLAIALSVLLHVVVLAGAVVWWLLHAPPTVPLDIDLIVVSEGNEGDSTTPPAAPSSSDAPLTRNTTPPAPAAPMVQPTTPPLTTLPLSPDVAPSVPAPATPPAIPAVKPTPPKPAASPQTATRPAPNLALPAPPSSTNGQSSAGVNGPAGGGDIAELSAPPPVYPPAAQRRGEEGRVVVRVDIGTDGIARNATVETSSGFKELDQAAIESTKAWRFRNDSGAVVQATRGVSFVLHPNDRKR